MSIAAALPKVTVPGPLTLLHAVVTVAGGFGSPSSDTVPSSAAAAGSVIVSAAPALTVGGRLRATVTVTVAEALPPWPSPIV